MPGYVLDLFVAPAAGAPVQRVAAVHALAGRGLEGDRYAAGEGAFSRWPGPGRALTLIDAAALAAAEAECGVALSEGQHRRNVVTEGVPLADLRGVAFQIGEAWCEGSRVCAPCRYLVRVTGQDRVFEALVRRGGLRAAITASGTIRRGDAVRWDPADLTGRRSLPG